jgi:hypothetical protein
MAWSDQSIFLPISVDGTSVSEQESKVSNGSEPGKPRSGAIGMCHVMR